MNEKHKNAIEFVESGEDAAESLQPTKQPLYLCVRQRAARLIHNQDLRGKRQRLGNLDQLLIADS